MTAAALASHLDQEPRQVNITLASARGLRPGLLYRVLGYEPVIGRRAGDLCLYAAKAGTDVPRKAVTKASTTKRRALTVARLMMVE